MKTETIEQYLARGGKVEKLDPVATPLVRQTTQVKSSGGILDLDEGAHFFSEFKPKAIKRKVKNQEKFSALPDYLRDLIK